MRWWPWHSYSAPTESDEIVAYNPDDEPAPLGDVIRRGAAAQRLLGDPTLAEAFAELRKDLFTEWHACEPTQVHRREQLYYEVHALNEVAGSCVLTLAPHASAETPRPSFAQLQPTLTDFNPRGSPYGRPSKRRCRR